MLLSGAVADAARVRFVVGAADAKRRVQQDGRDVPAVRLCSTRHSHAMASGEGEDSAQGGTEDGGEGAASPT